ncbi:MAG: trigger factor [Acidobacteria bacterium]|nr:trigger factor [Acidobacteriota bacterium]
MCKRILELEIPADKAAEERRNVIGKLKKNVALPGFRVGRAPVGLLERRFREAINQEVLEHLGAEAIKQAFEEVKVNPVGEPELLEQTYEEGRPIQLKIAFEVMPDVEMKDYRGLDVEFEAIQFEEAMVERELAKLQQQNTNLIPVTDRPVAEGDFATVDYTLIRADNPAAEPVTRENTPMLVREGMPYSILALELKGMSAGEEKEAEIAFPEDYFDSQIAGHQAKVMFTLKDIREKQVPELNDDFAKSVGEFATLDSLRDHISAEIKKDLDRKNRQNLERAVLRRLNRDYEFDVPDNMVNNLFREHASSMVGEMMQYGMNADQIRGMDWEKLREERKTELQARVREFILLQNIIQKEGIEVSDDDMEAEFVKMAEQDLSQVDELKQRLVREEGALDRLRSDLKVQKAMDILMESVNLKAPTVPETAEPEAEPVEATAEESGESDGDVKEK